jgi:hypothetical protein
MYNMYIQIIFFSILLQNFKIENLNEFCQYIKNLSSLPRLSSIPELSNLTMFIMLYQENLIYCIIMLYYKCALQYCFS